MQTFDCPKCGGPVTYNPGLTATARCAYCGSQLAVPNQFEPARILEQVQINVSPQVANGARKVFSLVLAIPIIIVVFVFIIIVTVFGMVTSTIRSVTAPFRDPSFARGFPTGSRSGNNANAFANQLLEFGSEGIGPGMMTDAEAS